MDLVTFGVAVVWALAAVVSVAKRGLRLSLLGVLAPLFWFKWSLELAMPRSVWARRFYSDNKMKQAQEQYLSKGRTGRPPS